MSTVIRSICRFLVIALAFAPFTAAYAGMLSTQQALSAQHTSDRAALAATLSRPEVASQLASLGVDPATAQQRVAAMSDDEVNALNGQIQNMPAGGMSSGWWWAIGVVVVAAIIWYAYGYQNTTR
jgi:hypothetical protein